MDTTEHMVEAQGRNLYQHLELVHCQHVVLLGNIFFVKMVSQRLFPV
jgi:hypothetical protein